MGQQRLEAVRRHRRRGRGHQLHRRHRPERAGHRAGRQQHVPDLSFTSPAGTTIADFTLTRQIGFTNPVADGTHRYYLLYTLGGTHFAGGGNCCDPTRNALNAQRSWYGYPENNFTIARTTVNRRSFPALNAYAGTANTLAAAARLLQPRDARARSPPAGGIDNLIHGSDITINDPTAPSATVEASGLLAGGAPQRLGPGHA